MPYKFEIDKLLIPTHKDKRVKLNSEQKKEIVALYATGNYSQRELAKKYAVSRRLIQFVINPKKLEDNIQKRNDRGGSKQYYNKKANTIAKNKHRKYKRELYSSGELIPANDAQDILLCEVA